MATLSIRLPDSLHRAVRELADNDQVSINQFISYALTAKVSELRTIDYLKQRAARANMDDFDKLLALVPDVEPDGEDRIPKDGE
jgi:predicted transcriptional regulator